MEELLEAKNKELSALSQAQDEDKSNEPQQALENELESLKLALSQRTGKLSIRRK
jgi:hypothetical protein